MVHDKMNLGFKYLFKLFIIMHWALFLKAHAFQDRSFSIPLDSNEENIFSNRFSISNESENIQLVRRLFEKHKNAFLSSSLLERNGLRQYTKILRSLLAKYPQFSNSLNIYIVHSVSETMGKYMHCSSEGHSSFQVIFIRPSRDFSLQKREFEVKSGVYKDCAFLESFLFQFILSSRGSFLIMNRSTLTDQVLLLEKEKRALEIELLEQLKQDLGDLSMQQILYFQKLELAHLGYTKVYLEKYKAKILKAEARVREDLDSFSLEEERLLDELKKKEVKKEKSEEKQKKAAKAGSVIGAAGGATACIATGVGSLAVAGCAAVGSLLGNAVGNLLAKLF